MGSVIHALFMREHYSPIQNVGRANIVLYLCAMLTYIASGTAWYFLAPDEVSWLICMFLGVALINVRTNQSSSVHVTKVHMLGWIHYLQ